MKSKIFFAHPHTLLEKVDNLLREVGAKNFFNSPDEKVKKAREGFAAYFFTLAMKKYTGKDWWLAQPDQAERSYPDFDFVSLGETPEQLSIESVELTGVYPHFKEFNEVMKVIKNKQDKYGPNPINFSLLIFINHEKSEEWIKKLQEQLQTEKPFMSIWTIHLLFKAGGKEVQAAVAHKIRPLPGLRVTANIDDKDLHIGQTLPSYMEEKNIDGIRQVTFKQDFINKVNLLMKRIK